MTTARFLARILLLTLLLSGCQTYAEIGSPTPALEQATATPPPVTSTAVRSPTPKPTETPQPTATPAAPYAAGIINLYPGPEHYAGDVLTAEITVHNLVQGLRKLDATVTIDDGRPITVDARVAVNLIHGASEIILPDFWDTRGQEGRHILRVQARLPRGAAVDISVPVEIRPAGERPAAERTARWVVRETECCRLYSISGTAAERDIDRLARFVEQSVTEVASAFDLPRGQFELTFFFIDGVWGNGGYASDEGIVIYYVDRDYGPGIGDEILTTFRHEVTHHTQWMLEKAEAAAVLNEGLAVFTGGGHYFTQPLPERAAALYRLGLVRPLLEMGRPDPSRIHEANYLESAGFVAYLVECYGWENFLRFYTTVLDEKIDNQKWETWLAGSLRENFDISVAQLERDYFNWLKTIDPGEQVDNLRLTLQLQEARREYQFRHAPFLEYYALGDLADIDQLSLLTREDSSPEAVAIEALIHSAQHAVYEGEYQDAEEMLAAIESFLATKTFDHPLAADYLSVARTLDEWGYEAQEITFKGDEVHVVVTGGTSDLQGLTLVPLGGDWLLATD